MSKATRIPDLRSAVNTAVILADGGMGSSLIAAGLAVGDCGVAWNQTHGEAVRAIHQAYTDTGCRILTTNTFQGGRPALAAHGLTDQVSALNRRGAELAREVADACGDAEQPCWVAGNVGPFGGFLEPLGEMTADQLDAIFTEQLAALRAGGAEVAWIETMSDPAEFEVAIAAARRVADWPVAVTCAYERHGNVFTTMMGTPVRDAVARALDAGADLVGANCGTNLSLDEYLELAEELVAAAGEAPVIVQPNAGTPQTIDGRLSYRATPEAMADVARGLISRGVRIIGGCCGTNPTHLAAMADALPRA